MTTIFTIGHSRHPAERFVALLKRHGVATLVDVRRRPGSRNPFLRSFSGYARTPAFGAALRTLLDEAGRASACIMCAEGDWRQCHRQIVADYLLTRGVEVRHIMPDGAVEAGALTPFAKPRDDGTVLYPKPEGRQLGLGLS
jgi:uncharacterized protein (DUF488 family)